jgi:hypothetical protein
MFAISGHASQPAGFLFSQIPSPTIFPRNLGPNFRLYIRERLEMTSQNEKSKKAKTTKGKLTHE